MTTELRKPKPWKVSWTQAGQRKARYFRDWQKPAADWYAFILPVPATVTEVKEGYAFTEVIDDPVEVLAAA